MHIQTANNYNIKNWTNVTINELKCINFLNVKFTLKFLPPVMQETPVRFLGQEDPQEKG